MAERSTPRAESRAWTTGMSEVLKEKMRISPVPAGRSGLICSTFSPTCMRTMSSSCPHSNSRKKSAPSALASEFSFFTPESVERISSMGLVISFSTWLGLELG